MSQNGLIYIITGDGKGKTTAAMGLALRAIGHNKKVLVVQFVKDNSWNSGEIKFLQNQSDNIDLYSIGEGFVGISGDNKSPIDHANKARQAFDLVKEKINCNHYDLVILDEINVAISLQLLETDEVINFVNQKAKHQHIVLTGRGAPQKLIDIAHMVSDIKNVKHPFDQGIPAQRGFDF